METVLIIDDEEDIREILSYNLKKEGFQVRTATNGLEGIELAKSLLPDIVLLDVMMAEMDGIEVCETLRKNEETKHLRICFLTARGEDYSQIAGLDAGADDYIIKPIKPRALISRINSFYKKKFINASNTVIKIRNLLIDKESHVVKFDDNEIFFPKKEFQLLYFLAKNSKKVYSRDSLLRNIWGTDVHVVPRTVDVHIRKIREKIGDHYINTIKGVGYKFIDYDSL